METKETHLRISSSPLLPVYASRLAAFKVHNVHDFRQCFDSNMAGY